MPRSSPRIGRPRGAATKKVGFAVLLGANIRRHRLALGMTQADLAFKAGMSLKYLGEIERGEANTTTFMIDVLATCVRWDVRRTFPTPRRSRTAQLLHHLGRLHDRHRQEIGEFLLNELEPTEETTADARSEQQNV
jgi:transcriptional regulator with XRE-family HTH domain